MTAAYRDADDGDLDVELSPGDCIHLANLQAAARARHFRDVVGRFASGVTVIAGVADGRPVGFTCQSFLSVSLEPRLVMFSVGNASHAWPLIREAGAFCANILGADQRDLAQRMATSGIDKFAGVAWSPAPRTGAPLLAGITGYIDCRIHDVHPAGDHFLAVGEVLALDAGPAEEGLIFHRGRYGTTG